MDISPLGIDGPLLIQPRRIADHRGYFAEVYRRDLLAPLIGEVTFIQQNESYSRTPGTVRGLHIQLPPVPQPKLVRCTAGAILDVVVDLRRASPSFGRHVAVRLDAASGAGIYVPAGFAHGFCTLSADCLVTYLVAAPYAPACERSLLWSDPALAIDWPVAPDDAIVSAKDADAPTLAALLTDLS